MSRIILDQAGRPPRRSLLRRLTNEATLKGATVNSGVTPPAAPAPASPVPGNPWTSAARGGAQAPAGPDLASPRGVLSKADLLANQASRPTQLTGTIETAPGAFRYKRPAPMPEMTRPLAPPAPKPAAAPPAAAPAPGGASKLRYVTGPKATPPAAAAGSAAKAATAAETAGKVATAGETAAKAATAAETASKVAAAGSAATKAPGFFRTLLGKAGLPLFVADVGGRATRAAVDATNPTNQGGPAGMMPGETPEQYRKRAAYLLPGQQTNPQQTAGGFFRRFGANLVGEGKRYVTELKDLAVTAGTAIGEGLESRTRPFSEDGTSPALSREEMAARAARQKAADEAAAAAAAPQAPAAPAPAATTRGRPAAAPAPVVPLYRRQADANAELHRRNLALRDETILTPGVTPTRSDKYQQALFRKTSAQQAQEAAAGRETALEQTRITAKGAVDAAAAGAAYNGAQFSKKVQDAHAAALASAQGDVAKKKIESALEALNETIKRGVPDENNEGKNRDLSQDEMTAAYDQYLSAVGLDPAEYGMGPAKSARKPTRAELIAERDRREAIRTGAAGAAT